MRSSVRLFHSAPKNGIESSLQRTDSEPMWRIAASALFFASTFVRNSYLMRIVRWNCGECDRACSREAISCALALRTSDHDGLLVPGADVVCVSFGLQS